MSDFITYLNQIQQLRKQKAFDKAWSLSSKALIDLRKHNDESWFMIYYQMAGILAEENKWNQALLYMGLMLKELKGVGGVGQQKFIIKILKKLGIDYKYSKYVSICTTEQDPTEFQIQIFKLIPEK